MREVLFPTARLSVQTPKEKRGKAKKKKHSDYLLPETKNIFYSVSVYEVSKLKRAI